MLMRLRTMKLRAGRAYFTPATLDGSVFIRLSCTNKDEK
jgi:hypothetical protein